MDERQRDEEGEGPERETERLNRKRRETAEVRGKRRGEILAPLSAYRSLASFASAWARDDLFSLVPSLARSPARACSRPAFRSHTDTAGLIRVRLTYCLIIGPPRERSQLRSPCRAGHFSRRLGIDRDWRESRACTAHGGSGMCVCTTSYQSHRRAANKMEQHLKFLESIDVDNSLGKVK